MLPEEQKGGGLLFWDLLFLIVECPPPKLPEGLFSSEFRELVHACMAADGGARPGAGQLLSHPWLAQGQSAGELSQWLVKDPDADDP